MVDQLLIQEKEFLLNDNNEKLYLQLVEEEKPGKSLNKEELTKDTLYELFVIENKADSTIAELFHLKQSQVRTLRRKYNISNKTKYKDYHEGAIYHLEENGNRDSSISNYEYE